MKTLFLMTISIVIIFMFGHFTLRWCKWYRKLSCKIGWHSYPDFDNKSFDGCSLHSICKWCGYEGMIDSQGNLF